MVVEVLAALLLGGLVLVLVLQPLYRQGATVSPPFEEPEDPEETRRGIALIALKEIDFDRATGKLSEADYEFLKHKYTLEAVAALREEEEEAKKAALTPSLPPPPSSPVTGAPIASRPQQPGAVVCPQCGPRPEPDARYCSRCGTALVAVQRCQVCRAALPAASRFCAACGSRVAA
jgi:hypothetical protein